MSIPPPILTPVLPPVADAATGYVSPDARKPYTTRIVLVAVVGLGLQMAAGLVGGLYQMSGMMKGFFRMAQPVPGSAVAWDGKLWYVETSGLPPQRAGRGRLMALALEPRASPQAVAELPVSRVGVLAGPDGLWVVCDAAIWRLEGGRLVDTGLPPPPMRSGPPFLHKGRPAVLEVGTQALVLHTLTKGQWRSVQEVPPSGGNTAAILPRDVRGLDIGDELHILCAARGTVCHWREGDAATGWQQVGGPSGDWSAIALDGQPAVFLVSPGPFRSGVVGLKPSPQGWTQFFQVAQGTSITTAVCPMPGPGEFIIMGWQPMAGPQLTAVKGGSVVWQGRPGGAGAFGMTPLRYAVQTLIPLVLALAMAGAMTVLMARYRVDRVPVAGPPVHLASLWRRAIAAAIDTTLFTGPCAVAVLWIAWPFIENPFDPAAMFSKLGAILAASILSGLWMLATLCLLSLMEGRTGRTPGKWLAGIRTVRPDLTRCGFGRALLRNLLRIVDGFFNYGVGMLLVALTAKRQRLGDIVAGTIVIRADRRADAGFHDL